MRLTVIGNCGSGKSTFSQKISQKLDIPYLQLDRLWFEAGGHNIAKGTADAEKVRSYLREKAEEFIKQEEWVSDGWYMRIQPIIAERADKIIFLDIPLWKRLLNHLKRMFFGKRHKELGMWDDFKFIFEIIQRTFTHDPRMRKFVEEHKEKAVILKSHKEANEFIVRL